jgi:putative oxidoreductase
LRDLASLVARLLIAPIFVMSGIEKISGYDAAISYMSNFGVPGALLPLVILTELGGGLAVLFGFFSRWAAFALAGFSILAALFFHTGFSGEGGQIQTLMFMKNLAMAGGLLLLFANGPGRYAVNQR